MTGRTIRDEVLGAWAHCLVRHGCAADVADAMALELEQICAGRGVQLPRTARREEPDANWADRPQGTSANADFRVARRTLRLSRSQLTADDFEVLRAAEAGALDVRHDPDAALELWVTQDGRNLTAAAAALEVRGLLDRTAPDETGRIAARLTEPGRRIWADLGELATAAAVGGESDG